MDQRATRALPRLYSGEDLSARISAVTTAQANAAMRKHLALTSCTWRWRATSRNCRNDANSVGEASQDLLPIAGKAPTVDDQRVTRDVAALVAGEEVVYAHQNIDLGDASKRR